MKTENLSTLKIHKLSQEQFEREKAAGNINETAFYLTPDEFVEDDEHPGCYYRMAGDEKEWLNPPFTNNVEYRTTERFGYTIADDICKPLAVYVKAIMIPNLPLGEENFGHGISLADEPIAIDYYGVYSTLSGAGSHQAAICNEAFSVLFTRYGIRVTSKQEAVGHNLQLVLKYAKEVEA